MPQASISGILRLICFVVLTAVLVLACDEVFRVSIRLGVWFGDYFPSFGLGTEHVHTAARRDLSTRPHAGVGCVANKYVSRRKSALSPFSKIYHSPTATRHESRRLGRSFQYVQPSETAGPMTHDMI